MKNTIITISREFGSGGRDIGREVAERLGIPCYDAEIIEKIIGETEFGKEYVEKMGEEFHYGDWFMNSLGAKYVHGFVMNNRSPQDIVWDVQRKVILELADKGPCVIVGRCADYILREREDLLKVFIHAPEDARMESMRENFEGDPKDFRKWMKNKDKGRRAYYRFYTDQEFGEVENYNLTLDSAKLGKEACVEIIVNICK